MKFTKNELNLINYALKDLTISNNFSTYNKEKFTKHLNEIFEKIEFMLVEISNKDDESTNALETIKNIWK